MNNKSIIYYALVLLSFLIIGCSISSGPSDLEEKEISEKPKTVVFSTNYNSYHIERSPVYQVCYSDLPVNGIRIISVNNYYPEPEYGIDVSREFILAPNDSFRVKINNCNNLYSWLVDIGEITIWKYKEIILLSTCKTIKPDSTVNYEFVFKTLKKNKGYICFAEKDNNGVISSNISHGLVIGYTTIPLNNLWIDVEDIKWVYNTEKKSFSTVSVKIKGSTNAYRLRGGSYGDGMYMAIEIPIQDDSHFEILIPVAFSQIEGIFLKHNSELLLYGTTGLPKIISLINPKIYKN